MTTPTARAPATTSKRPRRKLRARPDGTKDPAGEAGWFLERERVARGESIDYAAYASKLPLEAIEAIERGKLAEFASAEELAEALDRYASHLKFEPEPLIAHLCGLYGGRPPAPVEQPVEKAEPAPGPVQESAPGDGAGETPAQETTPRTEDAHGPQAPWAALRARIVMRWPQLPAVLHSLPRPLVAGAAAGMAVMLVILGYGLVTGPERDGDRVAAVDGSGAPLVTGATRPRGEAGRSPLAVPTVRIRERALSEDAISEDAPVSREEAEKLVALIEQTAPKDGAPAAAPPPKDGAAGATASEGAVYGERGDVRLVLRATEGVWIRVEDGTGAVLITRTLSAGDSYRVPNRSGLVLAARNAGALQYIIDGKPRGRLGESGDIVIGLPLDPDRLARDG